jgi:hypothetical protein
VAMVVVKRDERRDRRREFEDGTERLGVEEWVDCLAPTGGGWYGEAERKRGGAVAVAGFKKGAERVVTRTVCLRRALSGSVGGRKLKIAVNGIFPFLIVPEENLTRATREVAEDAETVGERESVSSVSLSPAERGEGLRWMGAWTASSTASWRVNSPPRHSSANWRIRGWE